MQPSWSLPQVSPETQALLDNVESPEQDDVLNWDEGMEGKGLVDSHGNVHTWDAEEYETHWDYCNAHGLDWVSEYFWIEPNGKITAAGMEPLPPTAADTIIEADPRLHYDASSAGWNF